MRPEELERIVPGWRAYRSDRRFGGSTGVLLRTCAVGIDTVFLVAWRSDDADSTGSIELVADGWHRTRSIDLRTSHKLSWSEGRCVVDTEDDWVWLAVHTTVTTVAAADYEPVPLLPDRDIPPARARFPVIDVHAHLSLTDAPVEERIALMDEVGVQIVVDAPFTERGETTADTVERFVRQRPDRFVPASAIDLSRVRDSDGVHALADQLRTDVREHGVVMVGEIHDKGFGVDDSGIGPLLEDPLFIDDRRLDPLWECLSTLQLPISVHIGEAHHTYSLPSPSHDNLRRLLHSPWTRPRPGGLTHGDVHDQRDRVLERFPRLTMISAHLDNDGEDLAKLADRLRRHPNPFLDIGQRHRTLARQPRRAADFLNAFHGRVLYGGDRSQGRADYLEQFRVLETDHDSFLPADRLDWWPLYGLALPDPVLEAIYAGTARRLLPRLPE